MSCEAMAWALDQKLPCAHKFVLVVLGDHADQDHRCWPSQSRLADICGLSRQYVNKVLGDLERDGWLTVAPRTTRTGSDASCAYFLAVPKRSVQQGKAPVSAGFVYVMASAGMIKIGVTRNAIERRLASVQTASGREVSLIEHFEVESMALARSIEKQAHQWFADRRTHGEWFDITSDEAVKYLSELVSTEATPGVNREDTTGVNREDTHYVEPKKEDTSSLRSDGATSAPPPVDPVKDLWDRGKEILGKQGASLIGQMISLHGRPAVLGAIVACETEPPEGNKAAYFIRCCEQRRKDAPQNYHDKPVAKMSPVDKLYLGGHRATENFIRRQGIVADDPAPAFPLLDSGRSSGNA